MTTKITLRTAATQPPEVKRVTESAKDVSFEINEAVKSDAQFVIFTDADSGKEFSVQPKRVQSIEAE
jgi:hypothetical protein